VVVDDDEGIRKSLDLLLTSEGCTVALAESSRRALQLLRQWPVPAFVLFDFVLPEGDGLDLLRGIAADASLQRLYTYI
jgi:CheY-like chemotaxis protein